MGQKQSSPVTLVSKDQKYELKLIKREDVSHDTRLFRFELPTKNHVLGLPIGKHVSISTKINDKLTIRSYTPVTSDEVDRGYVDFIIKVYFPNVHPKFPDGGKMTLHMENMKIGDSLHFRGPGGLCEYQSTGKILLQAKPTSEPVVHNVKHLGLIAGGSGITPMLQIMRHINRHKDTDKTKVHLLFANQTEKDILCRAEIDETVSSSEGQINAHYTLDKAPENWKYSEGFINAEMLEKSMPPPSTDTKILICGPPPMIKFACMPNLLKLGYTEDMIVVY